MTESKKQKKLGLGGRILIGIVIGLAIGFISPSLASALSPLGTIFLRLLKMIMVPLVFFSITSGVCKMGDIRQLASVGLRFVLYILFTSGLASAVGVIVGLIFQPGKGTTEFLDASANVESVTYNFIDNVVSWVPDNVVNAMATANMLQVIVFALFLGVALLSLGEKAKVFTSFIDQGSDVMLKIVEYIMAVSPIGIASLMATMVSTISGATMKEVVSFIIMDYGCGITILLIVYPLLIKLLARVPVISFMKKISEPMIVAVTTTSSAATLPISIKVAGEKLGVPEQHLWLHPASGQHLRYERFRYVHRPVLYLRFQPLRYACHGCLSGPVHLPRHHPLGRRCRRKGRRHRHVYRPAGGHRYAFDPYPHSGCDLAGHRPHPYPDEQHQRPCGHYAHRSSTGQSGHERL